MIKPCSHILKQTAIGGGDIDLANIIAELLDVEVRYISTL